MAYCTLNTGPRAAGATRWLGLFCAAACLLCAPAAWARLGGDSASVQSDQQAWSASSTQSTLAGATVFRLVQGDGVIVRQYVDNTGYVFAVGWEGPVLPDFERLLGTAYAAYMDAVRKAQRGVSIRTSELVLDSGGMMRAFTGRAFFPGRLPSGVGAQDIR